MTAGDSGRAPFVAVARALREWAAGQDGAVRETHPFCAACWPEQSARYEARWTEENRLRTEAEIRRTATIASGPGGGTAFESMTWHGPLTVVRQLEQSMQAPLPSNSPSREYLARVAARLRAEAPTFVGPMPWEVESFLHRYGGPDV